MVRALRVRGGASTTTVEARGPALDGLGVEACQPAPGGDAAQDDTATGDPVNHGVAAGVATGVAMGGTVESEAVIDRVRHSVAPAWRGGEPVWHR